ncbi:Ubiquitin carboxyl-terminal hydrolase [Lachnellula occidentalis]|uniref:Ubiquitin carboxyl-terminal hydrolase n=1 Tax=Lachnellula occidentalis TaxID=215460 RepID=A0A8H8RDG0_9HELO|nr:Ubiquitin carboxyl-terminal hydrolase [Lachnellula occidentalis]
MVTRKPVPQGNQTLAPTTAAPPYPVTPISTDNPNAFSMQDARAELRSATDSDAGSSNVWSEERHDMQPAAENTHNAAKPLPEALRVGPASLPQNSSHEALRPSTESTNPFLRRQATGSTTHSGKESSADAWGEKPAEPSTAPPPPPIAHETAPVQQFSNLSASEPSSNPWQPALDEKSRTHPSPMPQFQREDSGNAAWSSSQPPSQAPQIPPLETFQHPDLINMDEPESPAWDEEGFDEASSPVHEMPAPSGHAEQPIEDSNIWGENSGKGKEPVVNNSQLLSSGDQGQSGEGWNLVDHDNAAFGSQQSGTVTADGTEIHAMEEEAPALPPRISQEQPPAQPPRPINTTHSPSSNSLLSPGTPGSAVRTQKRETYEIKKIAWHDVTAEKNPRVSPILVQNANGPCPLLALVNALSLSTPANVETALVEALRSREQVSLGLLLDVVFDELMSGRRGDAAQELPDVSDLYKFLLTLHTGMNVNPRFLPAAASQSPNDPRNSMSHVHPSEREVSIPGTFEDTREMKLYSTFSIPLIHGWLPERDSPAYIALSRSAKSYEDAQNLMFREEELEDKIAREGLNFEEQATLEDIATIKAFFSSNSTQLTPSGLAIITSSLAPGAVAILFRNNHFSTLYRHPDTLQLLQLVTDMGYAGHEEVVWESLIDVTGENADFFSGDFRLVGGTPGTPSQPNTHESGSGWTTVTGRQKGSEQIPDHPQHLSTPSSSSNHYEPATPQSPNIEQEDHDLALALQLQEEEEERHRTEVAQRRQDAERDARLSQQYIEQQGVQNNNVPVNTRGGRGGSNRASIRGGSGTRGGLRNASIENRPTIPTRRNGTTPAPPPPVDPEAGVDAPPPSYEQASTQAAYVPPDDHPSHPNQPPGRPSAYSAPSGIPGSPVGLRRPTVGGPMGRRGTAGSSSGQEAPTGKERDCVVM